MNLPYSININGKLLDFSTPKVMAIINLTPDSFYTGSRMFSVRKMLGKIEKSLEEGADIIDIGACSTRPSASPISAEEETKRLAKPLKELRKAFPDIIVSVDTFRADVARWSVENFGVNIINDISGGELDVNMFENVADLQVPYILMHMRGNPQTMIKLTEYENFTAEILQYFQMKISQLIRLGVKDIIVDPGFGFAKTLEQNYELMAKMSYFKELGFPVLCGISRKTMIYKLLDTTPEEALNGTTVLNTLALMNGANILRVHDVKEAVETIKIFEKYKSQIN